MLSNTFICEQRDSCKRKPRIYRYKYMYDSNMASCVNDGILTYWCCSEDMIKDAQPGDSVVSGVYYFTVTYMPYHDVYI